MAKRLQVCWPVTSNKISTEQAAENSAACFSSLSQQRDIPIAEAGYMMGKTTVPVSYTHLDVYKRQFSLR